MVKIPVAESVKSEVTDFTSPKSQYGEIIQQKVHDESFSVNTVDSAVVEEMARSFELSLQSSHTSSFCADQQAVCRLQWYAALYLALLISYHCPVFPK